MSFKENRRIEVKEQWHMIVHLKNGESYNSGYRSNLPAAKKLFQTLNKKVIDGRYASVTVEHQKIVTTSVNIDLPSHGFLDVDQVCQSCGHLLPHDK
jgi:hypothetical protein